MSAFVSREELERLVAGALAAAGASDPAAAATARALVQAEIDGQGGHGLSRVESYVAQARSGKVAAAALPKVERRRPGVVMIDVAHGFFYPAIDMAEPIIVAAAREYGIAAAGFFRSHHAGALSLVVERIATHRLMALMFANTPKAMTAWGGTRPVFGTNPIAFAAPRAGHAPIVVDLALSSVARGKILKAAQEGKPIPVGWAKDADGTPTTDASAALKGTLAPIGDAKGAALALMVEVLAAALTGSHLASEATSFFDAEGAPPAVGQLLVVLDPAAFAGIEVVTERIAHLASEIEGDGARVPGSKRVQLRADAERDGVRVDESGLARLRDLAAVARGR